jgi:hypothetical protein
MVWSTAMNNGWIITTAALIVLVGLGHSWIGERKVMKSLLAITDDKVLNLMQRRFLRGCWHIGTLCWFAMAGTLLSLGLPIAQLQFAVLTICAVTFALIGLGNYLISGGRNPGWVGCLLVAAAAGSAAMRL